jgi:voltage-gated potassium channel Kch
MESVIIGIHLLFGFVFIKNLRQLSLPALVRAFRQNLSRRRPLQPVAEQHVRPAWLVGSFSFVFGLYFVVLFEWWMVNLNVTALSEKDVHEQVPAKKIIALVRPDSANFLHLPKLFQPYKWIRLPDSAAADEPGLAESSTPMQKWAATLLPGISITLSGAFMLFLGSIVPLCLMSFVLPSVQHDEAAHLQRLANAPAYAGQFYLAIIAQNPLFSITSLVVLIFLIIMPLIVQLSNKPALLNEMIGTDQILFIFTLLAAWISPLVYAGVHVDRTFSSYFNIKLSNLILGVRGHAVVLGFGDLGQRVVNRELMKLENRYRKAEGFGRILSALQSSQGPDDEWLEKVVSPDLNVEHICANFIIVDRNTDNFLFAASNEVLGVFGVVGALEKSAALQERPARPRVLVPIVQGDATEPFTLSRVNLERASFLISTVSQDERIREIFSRAVEARLRSIICVSRSNHMINLPHKAPGHPIALVYPKQNSGVTLGQRLIAATLKVQSTLPREQPAPRIILVGMNKSSHFMLDMFWHSLANLHDFQKAEYFRENLRFVVTSNAEIYTEPREDLTAAEATAPAAKKLGSSFSSRNTCFTRQWRSSFITGFRYFQTAGPEHPLYFTVPACVMLADEASKLERCYAEFQPDIVVINEDDVENSRMLLLRSVNSLERLKYEKGAAFRLPLILMGASRGDEIERKDIGDVFQFYEALNRLYQEETRGPGYPRNAYYRRQIPPRRLIGDSVQDALADTEEIISGIRDNWAQRSQKPSSGPAEADASLDNAFELNTCLVDTADSLARLTARLAGLEFSHLANEPIENFFPNRSDGKPALILRPSFQYIRHLKLDVEGRGFCLTGFADLQANTKEEIFRELGGEEEAIVARVFAKDTHNYMSREHDDEYLPAPRLLKLTAVNTGRDLDTQTFFDVMMGAPSHDAAYEPAPERKAQQPGVDCDRAQSAQLSRLCAATSA